MTMKHPLVSVVIPTKNSSTYLPLCIKSLQSQEYRHIEIIVVDNYSNDSTVSVAKMYTKYVYTHGQERSSQRNFGAKKAHGKYILFIDSDMIISNKVIASCVHVMSNSKVVGVAIPEESLGEGFWAQCKMLERKLNLKARWLDAARFFECKTFIKNGGYDEALISGEDWDLSQRIEEKGEIVRINELIYHNEGELTLIKTIGKKFYYAKKIGKYLAKRQNKSAIKKQRSIVERYAIYFSQPSVLFRNPLTGFGMLFMKTCEFAAGAMGITISMLNNYFHAST